jgi:hypothetical protein
LVQLIDQEPEYIVRAALKVDFLDSTIAKVWGVNNIKPIIVEFKFNPPHYIEDKGVISIHVIYINLIEIFRVHQVSFFINQKIML